MKIDFDQFIFVLSDTVDLVGVDELLHSKRVARMAWECGKILGYDKKRRKKLLYLCLLHDCGVSSTREHKNLINELDCESVHIHCRIGAERMEYFEPLKPFAETILYHHTHWLTLQDLDISEETKFDANLIYLVDRVDYLGLLASGADWVSKKDEIRRAINRFRGNYFCPELVDSFLEVSEKEPFWMSLEPTVLMDFIEQQRKRKGNKYIDVAQLKRMAELFAQIVDAKSPYTAEHSFGVARLSRHIAEISTLDNDTCVKLEIAGLLHDIGKLQVPDRLLHGTEPLDGEDLTSMRNHANVSCRLLKKITGFADIASWTANHHETLDGCGYPSGKKGNELCVESRILAIADIFQALAQKRPYRNAQPLENIIDFLRINVQKGRLDNRLVDIVKRNSQQCYKIATGVEA